MLTVRIRFGNRKQMRALRFFVAVSLSSGFLVTAPFARSASLKWTYTLPPERFVQQTMADGTGGVAITYSNSESPGRWSIVWLGPTGTPIYSVLESESSFIIYGASKTGLLYVTSSGMVAVNRSGIASVFPDFTAPSNYGVNKFADDRGFFILGTSSPRTITRYSF